MWVWVFEGVWGGMLKGNPKENPKTCDTCPLTRPSHGLGSRLAASMSTGRGRAGFGALGPNPRLGKGCTRRWGCPGKNDPKINMKHEVEVRKLIHSFKKKKPKQKPILKHGRVKPSNATLGFRWPWLAKAQCRQQKLELVQL